MDRRVTRLIRRALVAYAVALLLILHTPISEWLAQPLYLPPVPVGTADAIVVLEAWAFDDGELNESGLRRAMRGADLYRLGVAKVVIVTGTKASPDRRGSALAPMAQVITQNGVPGDALLLEEASANTWESAVHVAEMARQRGWTNVALVTDASHMLRASLAFKRQGLNVVPSSTQPWELGGAQPSLRLKRIGTLLHEYGGLIYYWWREWI